ncbi:hypothetical protein OG394_09200 [Kribbella sp. NBC_01245]|uniref:right-handed parallel beta-helix repeat-containing protein n=1 Tax=Kribbella sp. NBC_01245 TaxID=2903578 RepID=UPI002E27DBA6|nr:right-handed parallel beta-helix repeat-containing protein [Kribbella sp. NBC_01245]
MPPPVQRSTAASTSTRRDLLRKLGLASLGGATLAGCSSAEADQSPSTPTASSPARSTASPGSSSASPRATSAPPSTASTSKTGAPTGAPTEAPTEGGIDTATGPATIVTTGSELEAAVAAKVAAIHLGAGEYVVNTTLVLAPSTMLSGVGQASRIRASGSFNRSRPVIAIGNNVGPAAGVTIRDLVVDCDSKALIGIAIEGIAAHDYQGELDSMCRLDNLWVYDSVGDGVLYAGRDSRSVISTRVRVRRAGRHGFHIRNSDSWWIGCEATTRTPTGGTAGFFINAGASNFFEACKAWYCRDFGWRVSGVRNKFIGCEAQDTRLHGWNIEWDRNVFTGCVADSAGMYDVGGKPNTADGFYVATAGAATSLVGCQSFDRRPNGTKPQQRFGFNVTRAFGASGRLVAPTGYDNTGGLIRQR